MAETQEQNSDEVKQIVILIDLYPGGQYDVTINPDEDNEEVFHEDGVAGVRGRLAAFAENMHEYLLAEPAPNDGKSPATQEKEADLKSKSSEVKKP